MTSITNRQMNLHLLFIVLHSISGVIAFFTGWMTIAQLTKRPAVTSLWLYLGSLVGLVVFMIGAILAHWFQLANIQRFIYLGLLFLGIYMLLRAYQAFAVQKEQGEGWELSYTEHVGFTLISLFDGFVIVSAIDLGMPTLGVLVISVLGVAIGIYGVNKVKSNIAMRS